MKISYAHYHLIPLERLNAKADMKPKEGLYLKIEKDDEVYFSDYFPHVELGDLSVKDMLKDPYDNSYFQNCLKLSLLVQDVNEYKPFKNHTINTLDGSGVCKLKLKTKEDLFKIINYLDKYEKLRLDANGSFSINELNNYFKSIDTSKIEYIEDPSTELNWNDLIIPSATDFIKNKFASFFIIKPNRSIQPQREKQIISSYMGSDLGRIMAYKYLMLMGDLDLYHGIITPNIYQEQRNDLFLKDNSLNEVVEEEIYQELKELDWKDLDV